MSETSKEVLRRANAAIDKGDNEAFLSFCTDDLEWTVIGEMKLSGKDAVRRWMKAAYAKPPKYTVVDLVAEVDLVIALGDIWVEDAAGQATRHSYCDVWRLRDGKLAELRAFVIN
jgi:uncharacterized protein